MEKGLPFSTLPPLIYLFQNFPFIYIIYKYIGEKVFRVNSKKNNRNKKKNKKGKKKGINIVR